MRESKYYIVMDEYYIQQDSACRVDKIGISHFMSWFFIDKSNTILVKGG